MQDTIEQKPAGSKPLMTTNEDYIAAFTALYSAGRPTFFEVNGPLPSVGRTDTALAATPSMTVVLKSYAATGENSLHAHTTEDHVFIVLKGEVNFYGPNGEVKTFGPMHGVMLPHGSFYRFQASAGEPLVMLRIGGSAVHGGDMFARIGFDGVPMEGNSKENKAGELVLSGERFTPENFRS